MVETSAYEVSETATVKPPLAEATVVPKQLGGFHDAEADIDGPNNVLKMLPKSDRNQSFNGLFALTWLALQYQRMSLLYIYFCYT